MSHTPVSASASDVDVEHKYASEHLELGEKHQEHDAQGVLPAVTSQPKDTSGHIQGNVALVSASGVTRLVPTPTDSPRDPLTWSRLRKAGIILCVCWFSVFSLSALGGLGALAPYFFGLYGKREFAIEPFNIDGD